MRILSLWFRIPFWQRVLGGFIAGALAGWLIGEPAESWFGPLGKLYVTLIKMIAIPLVFFAVTHSVASLYGMKKIVALGGKTFLWFALTAVLAVGVGLGVAKLTNPGLDMGHLEIAARYSEREVPTPIQVLLDVVPSNPFKALADGKILQVIFFAVLLGMAFIQLGDKVKYARELVGEARHLMSQITRFVLEITPLGTFGLIAALVGSYGFARLLPLGNFVFTLYLACALHIVVVYSSLLLAHQLNPIRFFHGVFPAMQVAFTTSSSLASMPAALCSVVRQLGVKQEYAAFAVPLGASIKMDGCGAIYPAVASVFVAQYFSLHLNLSQYFVIMLTSVFGSFGTAGVPATAIAMVTLVFSSAGLPLEGIGYLVAIDRVLDMMRTLTNVTGQMLVPVLVAKEEGLLNKKIYDAAHGN